MDVLTKAIEETKKYVDKANSLFNLNISYPDVKFNLRGGTAGRACATLNWIKYNKDLLIANGDKFIARTVPHEVAHIVTYVKNGYRRIKPHGWEWKSVMLALGVSDITRCHNYDVSVARKTYTYTCSCREYQLTLIRHRKSVKAKQKGGLGYICKCCRAELVHKDSSKQMSFNMGWKGLVND